MIFTAAPAIRIGRFEGRQNSMDAGFAQSLLEHSPDPLLLLDPDGSISFLNHAAEELFGYSRTQLLGADASLLLAEVSREEFHGVLAGLDAATPRSAAPFAGSGRRFDGSALPVEITCSLIPAAAGSSVSAAPSVALAVRGTGPRNGLPPSRPGYVSGTAQTAQSRPSATASVRVPSAVAEHDDELRAGTLRDPLTALPNGTLFNDRLAAALRRPDPVDVLLLNLDDFKGLNDMLGRSSADELLVEVANRLRNCVRPHDTVARLGGDEFVVLLTECLNADAVAKRIADSLYEPLRVGGSLVRPGVSMGLASKSAHTLDGAELLRQADCGPERRPNQTGRTPGCASVRTCCTPRATEPTARPGSGRPWNWARSRCTTSRWCRRGSEQWSSSRRSRAGNCTAVWCRRTSSCRWLSRAA